MTANDLDLSGFANRDGIKWAQAGPGVIPAWVADMDFPVPEVVRQALVHRIDTDLGYPAWLEAQDGAPLGEAFAERMAKRYGFSPDPSRVRAYCDINQALQLILRLMTKPGDHIAIHTPAYHPFLDTLADMDRPALPIPLQAGENGWEFDLVRLTSELVRTGCRVLLLVNPHNPTGRVFRSHELESLAALAEELDLLVLSDEIHADLVYAPGKHIPFGSLAPTRTITLTSATKAFNLAGVRCCAVHFGADGAWAALAAEPRHIYGEVNVLGVTATLAAWREGDAWLERTLATLEENRRLVADRLPEGIGYRLPEATYLAWLDCSALGLADPAEFFLREAGVLLISGPTFGPSGAGYVRLNFATPTPVLAEILTRMDAAVGRIRS
ncbi:MalY/PatB family protein [Rhizohabitans arisaemae]|uniref:MalY/PatB family protein n=1 Tax=Rhizohabitans arisaemae TaxID=2720610 RepID=UPI0024B0B904|nr:aminotransferase class I/II-fold pyridoxal phosphate-dependent enzyme [Rhizohabitans arisaemae]